MKSKTLMAMAAGMLLTACAGTTANVARSIDTPGAVMRPGAAHLGGDGGGADALSIDVYPRIVSNEGDAWVRLRIEPDARSVGVDVQWWSLDGVGGAHLINLEGDRAAVRHQYGIKHLEPGEYQVTAILMRSDGSRVQRSTTLVVVGFP